MWGNCSGRGAAAYWQAQTTPVQVCPGGQVPLQRLRIPPQVNSSIVEVVDDVDVLVDVSSTMVLVEVDVALLLVVDGASVVLVEVAVPKELDVALVDVEVVAPGTVLLVDVVVIVVEAPVVDGRLVVVVTVPGNGSGQAAGAAAFRAANRPGTSFCTLPPNSVQ
jgi:hypothetical protein